MAEHSIIGKWADWKWIYDLITYYNLCESCFWEIIKMGCLKIGSGSKATLYVYHNLKFVNNIEFFVNIYLVLHNL